MNVKERLVLLEEAVDKAATPAARKWRAAIFQNILKYIKASNGDDSKFKRFLWQDYLAWTAWYFNGEKYPIYLTKKQYQMYVKFFEGDNNVWMYQRRAGKSLGTAVLTLYYAMTNQNKKILIFAPTEDQLVLMQEIRRLIADESATDLFNDYIGEGVKKGAAQESDDSLSKLGSKFNHKEILMRNGTEIKAVTLNVKGGGSSRRGFSANVIVVDEFQDIPPEIREEIIEPIIMDAFSDDKKLVYIGTPHTKVDPRLDLFWDNAQESKFQTTLHSHCWEAVEEGIRKPEKMSNRFRALEVPCKWVLEHGVCPVFLPKMYEEVSGESLEYDDNGKPIVPCGKICMDNPTFVQEDMAMFPREYGLGIPPEWIKASGHEYEFVSEHEAYKFEGKYLVMSIDWGDVRADTQICIWTLDEVKTGVLSQQKLTMIYQEVVNDPQIVGVKNPSASRVKELFHAFQPRQVIVDVTGKREQVTELITRQMDGKPPIPKHVFLTNDAAKKNAVPGFWFSGPTKAEMFDNMKEQFRLNKIQVPGTDIVFWDKYFNELIGLQPKERTQTRPYVHWGETMHLTDAVALGALVLQKEFLVPAYTDITFFDFSAGIHED